MSRTALALRSGYTAGYDTNQVVREIEERTKVGRENRSALASSKKTIDGLIHDVEREMTSSGSALQDLGTSIRERDISYARRALARVPLVRRIPILRGAAHFLSLKTMLAQAYTDMQDSKKRLEVELQPYTDYSTQIEDDLQTISERRQEAVGVIEGLQGQQAELTRSKEEADGRLTALEKGTVDYVKLESEVIRMEQEHRRLDSEIAIQKRTVLYADDALNFLRGYANVLHNYVSAGRDAVGAVDQQMKILEPCLQKEAQLVQLAEGVEDLLGRFNTAKRVYNTALLALAAKGEAIQRIVAETTQQPFFLPQVVDAAVEASQRGRQLAAEYRERLLASPTGERGECYLHLGLPPTASPGEVHDAYRQLSGEFDPQSGLPTSDPIRYAQVQDAYTRLTATPQLTAPAEKPTKP